MAAQKVNIANKQVAIDPENPQANEKFAPADFNALKLAINLNADELDLAPKTSGGKLSKEVLPDVDFNPSQFENTGTEENPEFSIKQDILGGDFLAQCQAAPGWDPDIPQIPSIQDGILVMIAIPTGGAPAEELGASTLSAGTPNSNSVPFSWTGVIDAAAYTLQLSLSNLFTSPISNSYPGLSGAPAGLSVNTTYYARIRPTAPGFTSGAWSNVLTVTTDSAGNITPSAPTLFTRDDSANTFNFTNAKNGATQIATNLHEYQIKSGGVWGAPIAIVTKPANVGDVAIDMGDLRIRSKAHTGFDASDWLYSTAAFTATPGDGSVPLTQDSNVTLNNVDVTGGNTYRENMSSDYAYLGVNNTLVLHADTDGFIVMDVINTAPSGRLVLTNSPTDATSPSDGGSTGGHMRQDRNYLNSELRFTGRIAGVDFNVGLGTTTTKLRLRRSGSNMIAEYFNGTWNTAATGVMSGPSYIRGFMQKVRNADGDNSEANFEREALRNVRISGFSAL